MSCLGDLLVLVFFLEQGSWSARGCCHALELLLAEQVPSATPLSAFALW